MSKFLKKVTRTIIVTATLLTASTAMAQDKLASVAPIDKKIHAIDSIALLRFSTMEQHISNEMPASALYPDWNNKYTTNYGVQMPHEYKIDLRGFHMPTDSRLVTSHYGYRKSFHRQHYGTDIKVYVGDTIRAAFSGKVRVIAYNAKGYGYYVIIRHTNGLETLYGHLSKQIVKQDQVIKAGEPIGLGGNTGRSTGSHLHFETRFLGQFIDPEKLFSFEQQDVLADYYLYRSTGSGKLLASNVEEAGGEVAMSEEEAEKELNKQEESRAFQQQKIAEQKAKPRSRVHKVKAGENLSVIARKCGTTVSNLCKMNKISATSKLRPGQILKYS